MTTQKVSTIRPPHWERFRPGRKEGGREGRREGRRIRGLCVSKMWRGKREGGREGGDVPIPVSRPKKVVKIQRQPVK